MSINDANQLTTASPIFFKNLTNLKNFAATITSIVKGKTLVVSVTTPATSITYPLGGDGTPEIPIYPLN
jgi:hypothetical protein